MVTFSEELDNYLQDAKISAHATSALPNDVYIMSYLLPKTVIPTSV